MLHIGLDICSMITVAEECAADSDSDSCRSGGRRDRHNVVTLSQRYSAETAARVQQWGGGSQVSGALHTVYEHCPQAG